MPTPKPLSPAFANIQFLISASQIEGLPQDELPEVARMTVVLESVTAEEIAVKAVFGKLTTFVTEPKK